MSVTVVYLPYKDGFGGSLSVCLFYLAQCDFSVNIADVFKKIYGFVRFSPTCLFYSVFISLDNFADCMGKLKFILMTVRCKQELSIHF